MPAYYNYTAELELLILDVLLPVYEKYQLSKGYTDPFKDIHPKLLRQINQRKQLAALLRPVEKQACKTTKKDV